LGKSKAPSRRAFAENSPTVKVFTASASELGAVAAGLAGCCDVSDRGEQAASAKAATREMNEIGPVTDPSDIERSGNE
jgi:hypothetical protein